MKRYILFDLDGTLTDPQLGITTCVQHALESFGIHEPDRTKLEKFIGPPLLDSFMEYYGFSKEEAQRAIKIYRERFQEVGLFENEIYPGIEHMLRTLYKRGFILAVASSKPTVFVERILEHFRIKQYFKVIVGSELDGRRSEKEEVVQETLRQLFRGRVCTEEVYMVGDRLYDVVGAHRHKIECIGVAYGYGGLEELKECKADYIVESVGELEDFLLRERNYILEKEKQPSEWPILGYLLLFIILKLLISSVLVMGLRWLEPGMNEGLQNLFFYKKAGEEGIYLSLGITVFFTLLSYGGAGGVLWLMDGRKQIRRERKVTRLRHIRRKRKVTYFMGAGLGVAAALGLNGLLNALGLIENSENYQEIANNQFSAPLLLGIICYGIVAPLAEEIVFRGIIFTRARRIYAFWISMVASSGLFAVYHMNLVQGLYAFGMGMVLCYVYEYFGDFRWPAGIHMAVNTMMFLMSKAGLEGSFLFSVPASAFWITLSVFLAYGMYTQKQKQW